MAEKWAGSELCPTISVSVRLPIIVRPLRKLTHNNPRRSNPPFMAGGGRWSKGEFSQTERERLHGHHGPHAARALALAAGRGALVFGFELA